MREIIFKGKSKITGQFVYGDLLTPRTPEQDWHIQTPGNFTATPVEKESIGQYTGFLDKNKDKVFEGDIVKVYDTNVGCYYCGNDEEHVDEAGEIVDCENFLCEQEVKWKDNGGYFADEDTGEYCPLLGSDEIELEIIGHRSVTQGKLL